MRWLKRLLAVLGLLIAAGAVLWITAPRETWPDAAAIGTVTPGEDLDAWLAQRESVFDDLTEGAEKRIFWAGQPGDRTATVLLYLHGFSATRQEISPVAERLARELGANLFATRFAGHGRDGAALAAASAADWALDAAEAMAVARRLGERIVVIGTSTGASIGTLMALDPAYAPDIAALIAISPNYAVNSRQAWMLDLPYARHWVPLIAGETRSWQPVNAEQARYWTTSYPSIAVFPMRTVQTAAAATAHGAARVPLLVIYSADDQVVWPPATARVIQAWGARVDSHVVSATGDPSHHVLAGDILSPDTTDWVIATARAWLADL